MAHLFYEQGWPRGFLVAGRGFIGVPLGRRFNDKNDDGKKGGAIVATPTAQFYEIGELLPVSADGLLEEDQK